MRNKFSKACAVCGTTVDAGEGTVLPRGQRSSSPVICDLCMPEVDEMEREAEEQAEGVD